MISRGFDFGVLSISTTCYDLVDLATRDFFSRHVRENHIVIWVSCDFPVQALNLVLVVPGSFQLRYHDPRSRGGEGEEWGVREGPGKPGR